MTDSMRVVGDESRGHDACVATGCSRPARKRGFCGRHYQRERKSGRLLPRTVAERFWSKVDKNSSNDCWVWTAGRKSSGYGAFFSRDRGGNMPAHVWAYEEAYGPLEENREVDHICRNYLCVNPVHLRSVTHAENMQNLGANTGSRSGVRGVNWSHANRWRVLVGHDGKSYHGGYFDDLAEAERAAVALRRELFTHSDPGEMSHEPVA